MKIGIVTPTYRRTRFLNRFIKNVLRQKYSRWELIVAHDGPGAASQRCVEKFGQKDRRIRFLQTEKPEKLFGLEPRVTALRQFATAAEPVDYVVFWDDDNEFFPTALAGIVGALDANQFPDVLLAPIRQGEQMRPDYGQPIAQFRGGDIDTSMLVVKLRPALENYEQVYAAKVKRAQDYHLFHLLRKARIYEMATAAIEPIGRYDGLRFFCSLRWKLRIPPLQLSEKIWFRKIRQFLRG